MMDFLASLSFDIAAMSDQVRDATYTALLTSYATT